MPDYISELEANNIRSKYITIDNIKLHYLEAGEGEVVLMLHGFPTSAYLWRNIMPKVSETHRAIALDLPGYGKSDKPLSASYSLNFYSKILTGFLEELKINGVNLVVHDLGGPIGLLWAVRKPDYIKRISFLNTLVYSNFSWGVILFGTLIRLPFIKEWLSSPKGIAFGIKFGMVHKNKLNEETIRAYQEPFKEKEAGKVLIKTASNISLKGFKEIEKKLPLFKIPIGAIYGQDDWILPNVKNTMERIKKDLPQTEVVSILGCGHFLQEDKPEVVSNLLSDFLNKDV